MWVPRRAWFADTPLGAVLVEQHRHPKIMISAAGISALLYIIALAAAATDRLAKVNQAVAVLLSACGLAVGTLMIIASMGIQ